MKRMFSIFVTTVLLTISTGIVFADGLKVDGYVGIDEEPNIVTFTGVKSFAYNTSLFAFVDFISEEKSEGGDNYNLARFYGEAKLTKVLWEKYGQWGMVVELDDGSVAKSLFRSGVSYCPSFLKPFNFLIRFLPYRSDNIGGQISISFHYPIFDWLFLEGWSDYNYLYGQKNTYIAEPQLGIKLRQNLYFIAEYRINCNPKGEIVDDLGLGLEYRF